MIVIKALGVKRKYRWDQFEATFEGVTFFHRFGWSIVIELTAGHTPYYIYAEQDSQVCGVLLLVEVKSWGFGHTLDSTPFCVYGGVTSANEAATAEHLDHTKALADKLWVDYLELRHHHATSVRRSGTTALKRPRQAWGALYNSTVPTMRDIKRRGDLPT